MLFPSISLIRVFVLFKGIKEQETWGKFGCVEFEVTVGLQVETIGSWLCGSRAQKRSLGYRQSLGVLHGRWWSEALKVGEVTKRESIERL